MLACNSCARPAHPLKVPDPQRRLPSCPLSVYQKRAPSPWRRTRTSSSQGCHPERYASGRQQACDITAISTDTPEACWRCLSSRSFARIGLSARRQMEQYAYGIRGPSSRSGPSSPRQMALAMRSAWRTSTIVSYLASNPQQSWWEIGQRWPLGTSGLYG